MRRHYKKQYQENPLKPKALNNRLADLDALGLAPDIREALQTDLSAADVAPDNAIYVLDWWRARLTLIRFLELPDDAERTNPKLYNQLFGILQSYANKYKITGFELALDAELQIDYWDELRHFIQMSGINPYFREAWPFLHRVVADLPTGYYRSAPTERVTWLGYLAKEEMKSTEERHRFRIGTPSIKLLRGAYWGDPVGQGRNTELPKETIVLTEGSHKPSWVLEFLKDAESNLEASTYFIPKVHEPFMTFPDKKCWVVVDSKDKDSERQSLGDCASGEFTDTAMVIMSLREPVVTSPQGTFYRTILRAEVVFPSTVSRDPDFEKFKDSVGVINQLRAQANSKPKAKYHKYIVPLLEQEWVAQLVRPNHRPDDIFWLTDLSNEEYTRLKGINPKLFDAKGFYQELKGLSFPKRLEEKIIEGIDFPASYVIEILSEIAEKEFDQYSGSARSGIVTRTLTRYLKDNRPDPQLQELLQSAEASIARMASPKVAQKFEQTGFQLSIPKIEEVFLAEQPHPLAKLAAQSLAKKVAAKAPGLEVIESLAHKLLLTGSDDDVWPQTENLKAYLIEAGIHLTREETVSLLENIDVKNLPVPEKVYRRFRKRGRDRVETTIRANNRYFWNLVLHSVEKLLSDKQDIEPIPGILEELVLDPETPYVRVGEILNVGIIELTEKQIQDLLSDDVLLKGRTLAALDSLETKIHGQTLSQAKKTLAIAHQAMFRLQGDDLTKKALPWINLPTRNLIKILQMPRINRAVRQMAIDAIEIKIKDGDEKIRSKVFSAVKGLLLRTKDKSLIKELLHMYRGHQAQYKLFHTLITTNIEWLAQPHNRSFFLNLIRTNLPATRDGYVSHKEISKPIYHVIYRVVSDNLVEDNCTFVLQLLFDTEFNENSKKMAANLLSIVLDRILEHPERLTAEMCKWFQEVPEGWGRTSHRRFDNKIPLTPKLLRQLKGLFQLSISDKVNYKTRECFLDLAVTIGQAMADADKKKLKSLAVPLVKYIVESGHSSYKEYLDRLLGRRRMKRRR